MSGFHLEQCLNTFLTSRFHKRKCFLNLLASDYPQNEYNKAKAGFETKEIVIYNPKSAAFFLIKLVETNL